MAHSSPSLINNHVSDSIESLTGSHESLPIINTEIPKSNELHSNVVPSDVELQLRFTTNDNNNDYDTSIAELTNNIQNLTIDPINTSEIPSSLIVSTSIESTASTTTVSTTPESNSVSLVTEKTNSDASPTPSKSPSSSPSTRSNVTMSDALSYLDKIKSTFTDRPFVYDKFLKIMKNFKSGILQTPEIIIQVKELFTGYPELILGFQTFLPPGYIIEVDFASSAIKDNNNPSSNVATSLPTTTNIEKASLPTPPAQRRSRRTPNRSPRINNDPSVSTNTESSTFVGAGASNNDSSEPTTSSSIPNRPPTHGELDYALKFVTRVKERFLNERHIYTEFLDTLHNYQQKKLKFLHVLEKINQLFSNHNDLKNDFIYFLPENIQEEARRRMLAMNSVNNP